MPSIESIQWGLCSSRMLDLILQLKRKLTNVQVHKKFILTWESKGSFILGMFGLTEANSVAHSEYLT